MSVTDDAAFVEVDWNAESAEILAALRGRFGKELPALASPALDELAANYATELPDTSLLAIGQELESLGTVLWRIPSPSDSFLLLITTAGDTAASAAGDRRPLRQARRRVGAPAKRLALADRIPYRRAAGYLGADEVVVGHRMLMLPRHQHPDSWVDLSGAWPPPVTQTSHDFESVAADQGATTIAAVVTSPARVLVIGDPSRPVQEWDTVDALPEVPQGARLGFHGDDLFVLHGGSAWRVPSAVHGGRDVVPLAHAAAPRHGTAPPGLAHSGDGRCWLLLGGKVREWDGKRLRRARLRMRPCESSSTLPVTNGFAYVTADALIELDTTTGNERVRPLAGIFSTRISALGDEWAAVLTRGHLSRTNDLLQLWNRKTDEWLRLPHGILGPETGVQQVLCIPEGRVWAIYAGSILDLGPLDALIATLRARPDCVLVPPTTTSTRRRFLRGI
ncbi:hypothetical protein J2Y69_000476 [Microbacterium resistens]|uniref:Uncharacterized protein n=1 Tax=Microbacterium resistens TaxID=156977 RepID=A0ABU1S8G1_9MICO|nr:hypothetical protein [Microbacterium resistens]MDR6865891.1 hypothetical protein [Microbacterium resistens]